MGQIVLLVESELDALAFIANTGIGKTIGSPVVPVAIGSASGGRLLRCLAEVNLAHKVILAFDADPAGDTAAMWWSENLTTQTVRLRPTRKDVTDMAVAGDDLNGWIKQVL
jgi:hypothetical protein